PEQMQLLNQLPPEQRQQAMEALRNFQEKQRRQAEQQQRSQQRTQPPTGAGAAPEGATQVGLPGEQPEIPTAEARSSVIVTLTPRNDLTPAERAQIETDRVLTRIRGSHYYELNDFGVLELPGLPGIPLRGLTVGSIE